MSSKDNGNKQQQKPPVKFRTKQGRTAAGTANAAQAAAATSAEEESSKFDCKEAIGKCKNQIQQLSTKMNTMQGTLAGISKRMDSYKQSVLEVVEATVKKGVREALIVSGGGGGDGLSEEQSVGQKNAAAKKVHQMVPPTNGGGISSQQQRAKYESSIIAAEGFISAEEWLKLDDRPHSQIVSTSDSFLGLVSGSKVLSDKSMFMMERFRAEAECPILSAQRCGQIDSSMTEHFFGIKTGADDDMQGNPFEDHGFNFKIMESEFDEFRRLNMNKWPVIHVQFGTIFGVSIKEIQAEFKKCICNAFCKQEPVVRDWLYANNKRRDLPKFDRFCNNEFGVDQLNDAIVFLAELLHQLYRRKVLVIIDDYDKPLEKIACNEYSDDQDVVRMFELVQGFLTKIVTNTNVVERVLLAGSQQIQIANMAYYGMSPNEFTKYFGFTEAEFTKLCKYFSMKNQKLIDAAKRYYNGYFTDLQAEIPLYSTNSCIRFLQQFRAGGEQRFSLQEISPSKWQSAGAAASSSSSSCSPGQPPQLLASTPEKEFCLHDFFDETGYTVYLKEMFKFGGIVEVIRELVNEQEIDTPELRQPFTVFDFVLLRQMIRAPKIVVNPNGKALFHQFLYTSGFLVRIRNGGNKCKARVPNEQTRNALAKKLQTYYTNVYFLGDKDFDPVTNELFRLFDMDYHQQPQGPIIECLEMERAMKKLLQKLPKFEGIDEFKEGSEMEAEEAEYLRRIRGNEDLIHFIVDMASIRLPGWTYFGTDFQVAIQHRSWMPVQQQKQKATETTRPRPDISISYDNGTMGMCIELKYKDAVLADPGPNALIALKQIGEQGYLQLYEKRKEIRRIVALGIYVDKAKKVDVKAVIGEKEGGESLNDFVDRFSQQLYNGLSAAV